MMGGIFQILKSLLNKINSIIVTIFIIDPDGKVAAIWDGVNVRKKKSVKGEKIEILHVDEVREKLQELQSNNQEF